MPQLTEIPNLLARKICRNLAVPDIGTTCAGSPGFGMRSWNDVRNATT